MVYYRSSHLESPSRIDIWVVICLILLWTLGDLLRKYVGCGTHVRPYNAYVHVHIWEEGRALGEILGFYTSS